MVKNLNEKPHFPYTYGDKVSNDDRRLSNYVAELMKSKKFQNYVTAVFVAVLALGSCARASSAIPPEYGEAAANVVGNVEQDLPPIGVGQNQQIANDVGGAGRVNLAPKNPGIPQGQGIQQPMGVGQAVNQPVPVNAPIFSPLIPPSGFVSSKPWAVGGLLSLGWLCITAYTTNDKALVSACTALFLYAIGKR